MGWERAKNCFPVPNELLQLNLPAGAVAVYIYLLCHADVERIGAIPAKRLWQKSCISPAIP